jgi:hypothetical protein
VRGSEDTFTVPLGRERQAVSAGTQHIRVRQGDQRRLSLHALPYDMKRVIAILGAGPPMRAIRARVPGQARPLSSCVGALGQLRAANAFSQPLSTPAA